MAVCAEGDAGPRLSTSVFQSFGAQITGPGLSSKQDRDLAFTRAICDLDAGYPLHDDWILVFGLGYKGLVLDWDPNPQHEHDVYHNAGMNLGVMTTFLDKWTWTAVFGFSTNVSNGTFCNTTQGTGTLWGEYAWREDLSFHIGALGRGGIEDYTIMPILGLNWNPEGPWNIALIVPINCEVRYSFNSQWSVATKFRYISERNRFRSDEPNPSGIFEYFCVGGEFELAYQTPTPNVKLSLSCGYTGFQELEVWDRHGRNKDSYDVDNGFFVGVEGRFTFPISRS